jgi:hypothetical protein
MSLVQGTLIAISWVLVLITCFSVHERDRAGRSMALVAITSIMFVSSLLFWQLSSTSKDQGITDPTGSVTDPGFSLSGRVIDSGSLPVVGAMVRITGPFSSDHIARNIETRTLEGGEYHLSLRFAGGYAIQVSAQGFASARLLNGQDLPEVKGHMLVPDIILRRPGEILVRSAEADLEGAEPRDGNADRRLSEPSSFPHRNGVRKEEVPALLLIQGLVSDVEEISQVDEIIVTGAGWTTSWRDGTTIYIASVSFSGERLARVRFSTSSPGKPAEAFIWLRTGGLTFPPGDRNSIYPGDPDVQESDQTEPLIAAPPTQRENTNAASTPGSSDPDASSPFGSESIGSESIGSESTATKSGPSPNNETRSNAPAFQAAPVTQSAPVTQVAPVTQAAPITR